MDFIILLIIGLGIIFTTWKSSIEKKGGLLFIFGIYLIFLLWTGYLEWDMFFYHGGEFQYTSAHKMELFDTSDVNILGLYFYFYGVFYILGYSIYFIFLDKKLNLKKKIYFFLRDFIMLFSVFVFYFFYCSVVGIYYAYYDWYKNPDNFGGEEFVCIDNSVTLLLEQNYRHPVIVNPYNNFYEFYKHFGEPIKNGTILTNKLPKLFTHEDFLITCKNEKGENYYEKYRSIHGSEPYFKKQEGDYYTEIYSLSDDDQKNLLISLRKNNVTALKYRKQDEKTIHTQINDVKTSFEIYTDTFGSGYCRGGKLILKNKFKTNTLFEHEEYCIVDMKLGENNILNISLNYGDGGGSGEGVYIDVGYDIGNKIWEFFNTGKNHSHDGFGNQDKFIIEGNKVIFSDYEYIDKRLDDVYKYFQENYTVK